MKNFIASLKLRLSDLFLFIGFLPFAIFLIFGQLFMQFMDPNAVALPLAAIIPLFIVSIGCWGTYLYLEFKKENNAPKQYITWTFVILAVINVITIIVQPSNFVENVICRALTNYNADLTIGETYPVTISISAVHKTFFVMDIILVLAFIYIGLFVFPKRLSGIKFIKYLGYALFLFLFVLILYGYISEYQQYPAFLKAIFSGEKVDLAAYSVKSFILHRNAYGMAMMLGIIFCFINHAIERKWYYWLLMAFFFINMIFSWCKTGLLISVLMILIYIIYILIETYKEHKKRNTIALSVIGVVAIIGVGLVGISLISKGKYLGFIYSIFKGSTEGGTLDLRSYIWDNSYQLLRNGWWLIGRGFGTYNTMLMPMNITSIGEKVFPAHNSYVGLLAEGGILYLLAYLALLIYMTRIIIKDFKKSPTLTIAMTMGVLAFFLYSMVEAIQYIVYIFLFPLMVLHYSKENSEIEKSSN